MEIENIYKLMDRTVIVTGAGQGIGRAISESIIRLGGRVVAVDMNADTLKDLESSQDKDRMLTVQGNVVTEGFAESVVEQAVSRFGSINGLVNNAGIIRTAMINKMTLKQWQEVIDVHLTGAFHFSQAVGRYRVDSAQDKDSKLNIVNITSDAGRRGTIGQVNYGVAKAGVLGLTMSCAREWGRYGIRVNSVGFGIIETPMTEVIRSEKFRDQYLPQIILGRFGKPEEVALTICFLLSDASSYITGQHIFVNGGMVINI